jgi:transposase
MELYNAFVGIDIGKFEVVVATNLVKKPKTFKNTLEGFQEFWGAYQDILNSSLVILETTGGYERLFLLELMKLDISTHRANTRQVKAFIRSLGIHGKTDGIDAYALAQYGLERHQRLGLYQRQSVLLEELQGLAERRLDLNKTLVQEKNRSQAPTATPWIQKSCQAVIKVLKEELECVLTAMNVLLETCPELAKRKEVLQSIAGIGEVISMQLIALLPELGYLNRRAIASLVGLAPHPNESGTKTGQRRTKGGRQQVRNILLGHIIKG